MTTKFGFNKMTIEEFETWVSSLRVARTVLMVQEHHTWNPDYSLFNQSNHFELQKGMKDYHVNANGWADIGQHFTSFPDGAILTGRSLENSPACIYGNNANSVCIENLGNFDAGRDSLTVEQGKTIVRMTAAICKRFNIPVNSDKIVYHHWFNLSTGERNNGTKNNKSCPGTNFFGGNRVEDCEANFLPQITAAMNGDQTGELPVNLLKYVVSVTPNDTLSIRVGPAGSYAKANDREPVANGSILRVYQEQYGWYKISNTQSHWVASRYAKDVVRAVVNTNTDPLSVRNGPGTNFEKVGSYLKGQEVFVQKEENGWCKISLEEKWVKKDYLNLA